MAMMSMNGPARRLPIYLLIDTSSSMAGAPIQAVNQGIQLLQTALLDDPQAIETVFLSVITFDAQAQIVHTLTELTQFTPPALVTNRGTYLGEGLRLLNDTLDNDIIENTPTQRGDYKPLVFLLTDGYPADQWYGEADRLKNRANHKVARIIALIAGDAVDDIRYLTEDVYRLMDTSPETLSNLFIWISQSVSMVSNSAQGALGGQSLNALPEPPDGINIVA